MSDPLDDLFEKRFWVKVEERAFYNIEEIKEFGIAGVNSLEEAEFHLNSMRTVRITIIDFAEYMDKGFKVHLANQRDVDEVFGLLNHHLNSWLTACNTHGYIPTIPPIEEFEILDNLAEKLYPFANKESAFAKWRKSVFSLTGERTPNSNAPVVYTRYSPKLFEYCDMVHGSR